jgi:hypothetical protein
MQLALILEQSHIDDAALRTQVIQAVRHTRGILNVDTEIAENGLLLITLTAGTDHQSLLAIEGVASVETMGVKSAI